MEWDSETILFYGLIFLLILVIITLITLLIHSGFFTEINVETCKPCFGEIRVAYKSARGPYKESGTLFTEVHTLLPQYRTIGVYYDDPRKKDASRLRYIVGLIVSENGEPTNQQDEQTLKEWDYKFVTFPSVNHVVQTSFPFKSTLSIIVAIFRVYPILDEYIEMRSLCVHPFIEIYDSEKGNIFFVGPLEKQDSFYVPEVNPVDDLTQGEEEYDEEEEDEDDRSSVSWDDSASYIKSEVLDSDSLAEDGHSVSLGTDHSLLQDAPPAGPVDHVTPAGTDDDDDAHVTEGNHHHDTHTTYPPPPPPPATDDTLPPPPKTEDQPGCRSPLDEDSDNNTASSFEEIDEQDAPQIKDEEAPPPLPLLPPPSHQPVKTEL